MFHTAQKLCSTYMAILLLTLWLLTSLEFFSQYVLWQNNTSNTTSNFKFKKKKRRRLLYLHSGGDRYKQWTCFQIIVAQCRCNGSGCCLHQATFQGCWNQYRVDSVTGSAAIHFTLAESPPVYVVNTCGIWAQNHQVCMQAPSQNGNQK